jgi:hypothetical protein
MRGKTIGSSASYNSTAEERKVALLYMYANIDVMTNISSKYFLYIYTNQHDFVVLVYIVFMYFFHTVNSTSNVENLGVNIRARK